MQRHQSSPWTCQESQRVPLSLRTAGSGGWGEEVLPFIYTQFLMLLHSVCQALGVRQMSLHLVASIPSAYTSLVEEMECRLPFIHNNMGYSWGNGLPSYTM